MPRSAADKQAALLAKNAKALEAIEAKISKATTNADPEKIEKATARVENATKSLARAQARLNALQNAGSALTDERQRLLDEQAWIQAMPVGQVGVGQDVIFDEDEDDEEYDEDDADFGTEVENPVDIQHAV